MQTLRLRRRAAAQPTRLAASWLPLALTAASLTACAGAAPPAAVAPSATTELPHIFTLRMNESLTLPAGGLRVTFNGVRDSRCPRDVQCISAGAVRADLWVEPPDGATPQQVTLTWGALADPPESPSQAAGYQFCFQALQPRPAAGEQVRLADYLLRFSALRLANAAHSDCSSEDGAAPSR